MTWKVRFFIVGRQIVMPHQFVQKTGKTPVKDLAIARRRMKELTNGKLPKEIQDSSAGARRCA